MADQWSAPEHARRRSAAYGLLARLLQSPVDAPLLAGLSAIDFATIPLNACVPTACQELASFFAAPDAATSLRLLAADYARLFVDGSEGSPRISLFESVQFASDDDDAEDLRADIDAMLDEESILVSPDWQYSRDHAAVELEIMQVLARRLAVSLEKGDRDEADYQLDCQEKFFEAHIGNWMPKLASQIQQSCKTGFYRAVAYMLQEIIDADEMHFSGEDETPNLEISA